MKILRKPTNQPKQIEHPACGATLEVVPGDIEAHGQDRDGSYCTFKCANCGGLIYVDVKALGWKFPPPQPG